MHLKLIAARAAAADANPNNHGHHYGQLKHQHPPLPAPTLLIVWLILLAASRVLRKRTPASNEPAS